MTADELKTWRDRMKVSQGQLAALLEVAPNTIARWENGKMAIPGFLPLALATIERRGANVKARFGRGANYLKKVLEQEGLSPSAVAKEAERKGFSISTYYVMNLLRGMTDNPGAKSIEALAAGIRRPAEEVFDAFRLHPKKTTRSQKR